MTQAQGLSRRRLIILGAAGRDFHNFNMVYRDDADTEVVAFTAQQIPGIDDRSYPPSLAGPLYPDGIPIIPESELEERCAALSVDEVVMAYSDVTHVEVMHLASRVLSTGSDFLLLGPRRTQLVADRPVIAVSAVRTGCGKSQTARWLCKRLSDAGTRVVAIRHPMPYGDLVKQGVQRFAVREDLDVADCTNEEREEYEPYLDAGGIVFAGVDYAAILEAAQKEADVIVWDGGNNDLPFLQPDLHIVIVDALRPDHVDSHHPGEAGLRSADVIVVNKVDVASDVQTQHVTEQARGLNPGAVIFGAASPLELDDPDGVRGRRVVVVDDGPTLTHGGMAYGAGYVAAVNAGAAEIVDPLDGADPAIAALFETYPHLDRVLPAVGYSDAQRDALRRTLDSSPAEVIVSGTPFDLASRLSLSKPVVRARYRFQEVDDPGLGAYVDEFLSRRKDD